MGGGAICSSCLRGYKLKLPHWSANSKLKTWNAGNMSDLHDRAREWEEVGKVHCFIKAEAVWSRGRGGLQRAKQNVRRNKIVDRIPAR